MNKKGFAISVILYSVIFLIIAILYMLLGITKTRYTVNKTLRENIIKELNVERAELEYQSDEVCEIIRTDNSTDFVPDLTLEIQVNYGKSYKFDHNSWSSNNSYLVDHAGTYIGYFRDTNGGTGTCSADVTSKTMYRFRASQDEQWSIWQDTKPTEDVEIESRTLYKLK